MKKTVDIQVQQLTEDGKVWRQFRYYRAEDELEQSLDRIRLAFNMEHTRILVNGEVTQ